MQVYKEHIELLSKAKLWPDSIWAQAAKYDLLEYRSLYELIQITSKIDDLTADEQEMIRITKEVLAAFEKEWEF